MTALIQRQWQTLATAAGQAVLRHPPKMCGVIADAFFAAAKKTPSTECTGDKVARPVIVAANNLFARPSDDALFSAVAAVHKTLPWRAPNIGKFLSASGERIMFLELIGETGMVFANTCRAGLFFQLPRTPYPPHAHAAEEIYHIISGEAEWRQDFSAPTNKTRGDYIHHPPWRAHATTSFAAPLLALWGWTGDVDFASYKMQNFAARENNGDGLR